MHFGARAVALRVPSAPTLNNRERIPIAIGESGEIPVDMFAITNKRLFRTCCTHPAYPRWPTPIVSSYWIRRMLKHLKELDRILRGERTSLGALRDGSINYSLSGIALVLTVLGLVYGFCMGWFALFNRIEPASGDPEWRQVLASMIKVPALFLLTLVVTFPSLYVFNTLVGSRLRSEAVLKLLIAAMAVTMAVLASFGPIVAFFSVTTESYSFVVLLNVLLFSAAGVLGCTFLLQTLQRLTVAQAPEPPLLAVPPIVAAEDGPIASPLPMPQSGALDRLEGHVLGPHVKGVFRIWIIVFGLVGAQMAWILRPFIGQPNQAVYVAAASGIKLL